MDLLTYIMQNIPSGWEDLFKSSISELKQISDILEEEKKSYRIVPEQENIFKVFELCKPKDLTVVIAGQDPYFQILPNDKPRALGLSFSVSKEDSIPSSLHNIYKEIKNCYPDSIIPLHGDISHWVPQGVFLLNAGLTCRAGEPGSHVGKYKLWSPFINKFIKYIATINKDILWIMWGKDAQKFTEMIDKSFNNIYEAVHPSGLSASRGFFGCNHFKIINEKLKELNRVPIKWLEQEIPNIGLVDKVIQILSPEDLLFLTNFYKNKNDFNLDLNKFSVSSYIKSLADICKTDIKKYYEHLINLYEKYMNLGNTVNALKIYYTESETNEQYLYKLMIDIRKDKLDSLVEHYKNFYVKDSGMNLQDYSLYILIRSVYPDKSFEEIVKQKIEINAII